jgi:hypothetical protein
MATCPIKSDPNFQRLEKIQGTKMATYLWDKFEGNPPGTVYTNVINKKTKSLPLNYKLSTGTNKILLDFVRGLNIKVEGGDIAEAILNNQKGNPLAAFDILQKYMAIRDGGEEVVPKQVANVLLSFLGKKSELYNNLWFNIKSWSKYDELYRSYRLKLEGTTELEDILTKENIDKNSDVPSYFIDMYADRTFNFTAHKQVIIDFISEGLTNFYGRDLNDFIRSERGNADVDKVYFQKRGFKYNPYDKESSDLTKLWYKIHDFFLSLFRNKFDKLNQQDLENRILDLVDDIYKGNYKAFTRSVEKVGDSLLVPDKNNPEKFKQLEIKKYQQTLSKDAKAKSIIDFMVNDPKMGYKLSGSMVLRYYGSIYRAIDEDIHDIDGIIPLSIIEAEENYYEFYGWLHNTGVYIKDQNEFTAKVKEFLENQNWYKSFTEKYPTFKMTNAFIGKDHKANQETVTVQGIIPILDDAGNKQYDDKGNIVAYVFDFFVRTNYGNYPDIFDNYFFDWKQIFEAKIKMGRSKDLVDLIYYDPFIDNKFKFTNAGFRYFSFADSSMALNIDDDAEPTDPYEKPSGAEYAPTGYPQVQDETNNSCKL